MVLPAVFRDPDLAWAPRCPKLPPGVSKKVRKSRCRSRPTPHPPWTAHEIVAQALLQTTLLLLDALAVPRHQPRAAHLLATRTPQAASVAAEGGGRRSRGQQTEGTVTGVPPPAANASVPLLAARLPSAVSKANLLGQMVVCASPLAHFSIAAGGGATAMPRGVRVTSGNWSMGEDVRGNRKPGWWTGGPAGSAIEFDVNFGEPPRAMITFLRGYDDDFGEVRVSFRNVRPSLGAMTDNRNAPHRPFYDRKLWMEQRDCRIDARRRGTRVTQSAVFTIMAERGQMENYGTAPPLNRGHTVTGFQPGYQGIVGFGMPPFSNATLRLELVCAHSPRCRFKVLAVTSC